MMADTSASSQEPPQSSQPVISHNIENLLRVGGEDATETPSVFTQPVDITHTNSDTDTDNDGFITVGSRARKRHRISSSQSSDTMTTDQYKKLSLDDKLSAMFKRMDTIEHKVDQCININTKVEKIETKMSEQMSRIKLLEYKSLDQEARNRRNNLLFMGINESMHEDCNSTFANFLRDYLGIDNCPPMPRVHRLGRHQRGKNRPIIAYFLDYRDTEFVLSRARRLKNTSYSINRDFPQEIADARRQLWHECRKLRAEFPNSKVSIAYPAKIIKDGRVVADMFPDWSLTLRGDRVVGKLSYTTARNVIQPARGTGAVNEMSTRNTTANGNRPALFSEVVAANQRRAQSTGRRSVSPSARVGRARLQSCSPRGLRIPRGRAPSRLPTQQHSSSQPARTEYGTGRPPATDSTSNSYGRR